jgi:membrane glycosyltransferase
MTMMGLGFAPRLLGVIDVLLSGAAERYGGCGRLLTGSLMDLVFCLLIGPVMMIAETVFIVGLLFGRRVVWEAQNREDRSVRLSEAVIGLWPQMAFGALGATVLLFVDLGAFLWALPTLLPCLLAAPFACVSASRRFGRALVRRRLCEVPHDFGPDRPPPMRSPEAAAEVV